MHRSNRLPESILTSYLTGYSVKFHSSTLWYPSDGIFVIYSCCLHVINFWMIVQIKDVVAAEYQTHRGGNICGLHYQSLSAQ